MISPSTAPAGPGRPHAVVAGAGVGGLATAIGLRRIGWSVTVCERSPDVRRGGTGLGLTPNGLRALDAVGMSGPVLDRSVAQRTGGIRRTDGTWISRQSIDFVRRRFGFPTVAVHRGEFLEVLESAVPADCLRTGVTVTGVLPGTGVRRARVRTTGGDLDADLVVGADGIRSAVRASLFPGLPPVRYSGYTSWRFVVGLRSDTVDAAETWGPGQRVSLLPLPGDRIQCSVLVSRPREPRAEEAPDELARRIGHWHDPIPRLLADVHPPDVLHHDVLELGELPPAYHAGRAVLAGDAAHAMTPNLGSANLALEDAVTLVALVARHGGGAGGVPGALRAYTALRRPRTRTLAGRSRRIGQVAQWSSAPACAARELAVRAGGLLPAAAVGRSLDFFMGWQPPTGRLPVTI